MCGNFQQLKHKSPKAKKDYRCDWCYEKILTGEVYDYLVGIFESDFSSSKLHIECAKVRDSAPHDSGLCEGWFPGEFKRGSLENR